MLISYKSNVTTNYTNLLFQVHGTRHCNISSCFRYMLREGGVASLWRGNGINVLKIGPETALKFMAYEQVKRAIKGNDTRELGLYERFMAGSMAGGISQSAIYPLEVWKRHFFLLKNFCNIALIKISKR